MSNGSGGRDRPDGDVTWARPKRLKLSEQIAEQILGQIASGALKPGDRLPSEAQLQKHLGVGRAGLREALLRLAGMGVLDMRHGSGVYVSDRAGEAGLSRLDWSLFLESRQILKLVEARKLLEVQMAALAAERATDDDLERMCACLARMRASATRAEYVDADLAFHRAIARGTQNEVLERLLHTIRDLTQRTVWQSPTPKSEGVRQHEGIFQAIDGRDPAAAREAMYRHLHEMEVRTRALLDGGSVSRPSDGAPPSARHRHPEAAAMPGTPDTTRSSPLPGCQESSRLPGVGLP